MRCVCINFLVALADFAQLIFDRDEQHTDRSPGTRHILCTRSSNEQLLGPLQYYAQHYNNASGTHHCLNGSVSTVNHQ